MPVWTDTLRILNDRARVSDSCLVAFSGGKDSLVTLDLCRRSFRRVVCFFMYFVPGLKVIDDQMKYAKDRWGVEMLYYPHQDFFRALQEGTFGRGAGAGVELPELTLRQIYDWALLDTGIQQIATGAKASDGMARRRFFKNTESWDDIFYPLKGWLKQDVLAYCRVQNIPVPQTHQGTTTGVGLSTRSLCWLHDSHPEDFATLCSWFPFAPAVIARRQFYGIGKNEEQNKHSAKLARVRGSFVAV
jgi:phosphoadenosine phosphosulfate reductase